MEENKKAVAKGGPKTVAGKAASSLNSTKHGILGAVAPREAEAYAHHLAAVRNDRQPDGYLQEVLTDRIALSLWRLGRVASYEASGAAAYRRSNWDGSLSIDFLHKSEIGSIIERRGLGIYHSPESLQQEAKGLIEQAADSERLGELCRKAQDSSKSLVASFAKWKNVDRCTLAQELCSALSEYDVNGEEHIGLESDDDLWDREDFTPDDLVTLCEALGPLGREECPDPAEWGLFVVALRFSREAQEARRDAEKLQASIYENLGSTVLPRGQDLDKIAKYEAHLERTLYKALHELEALQDRSKGKDTPMARVQVHGAAS